VILKKTRRGNDQNEKKNKLEERTTLLFGKNTEKGFDFERNPAVKGLHFFSKGKVCFIASGFNHFFS